MKLKRRSARDLSRRLLLVIVVLLGAAGGASLVKAAMVAAMSPNAEPIRTTDAPAPTDATSQPFTARAGEDEPREAPPQGEEGRWLFIKGATDEAAFFPILRYFQEKNPDIQVHYEEVLSPELYSDFRSEYQYNDTTTDIIISSAMDLQAKLINDGYAQPFTPANFSQLPEWATWRHEGFGISYEPLVIVYNKAMFNDRPLPDTHEKLANQMREVPAFYLNKVGTYDTRHSGVGYLLATQDSVHSSINGRLLESLGRAKARTYCCTSQILHEVAEGRLALGYNVLGSYALSYAAKDPRLGIIIPSDYTLVMSRIALISKKARSPALARRFLDFLLSEEGQDVIASQSGLISILGSKPKSADWLRQRWDSSYHPINLGLGLLVFLDQMKRNRFIREWESALKPGISVPPTLPVRGFYNDSSQ
ncbi:ABC transporter substrate-binding protein [Pokkaliibacter sp. CJK22405]|uniref:ABC transporter substrate-binding protein n=1 Tax=Pokkaliibacter sp. CJK22405 TaxID=3384615 RepID=UPI003984F409